MNEDPPKESDEEFLARYDGKWFQPEIKRLIRIESLFDEKFGFGVDHMPLWAAKMFGKTASVFDLKPSSPEMTDEKQFGKILGAKVACTLGTLGFLRQLEAGNETVRQKLAHVYNALLRIMLTFSEEKKFKDLTVQEILVELRTTKPESEKILAVRKKAMSKVQFQTIFRQGRFFEGYGEGLLVLERMREWAHNAPKRSQNTAYIKAFAFMNWQLIQECSKNGTWADLLDEFTRGQPDGVEISADAFQKDLRREGLGSFGKPGRPRSKTRTTS